MKAYWNACGGWYLLHRRRRLIQAAGRQNNTDPQQGKNPHPNRDKEASVECWLVIHITTWRLLWDTRNRRIIWTKDTTTC